jgi:hypothetical protein
MAAKKSRTALAVKATPKKSRTALAAPTAVVNRLAAWPKSSDGGDAPKKGKR